MKVKIHREGTDILIVTALGLIVVLAPMWIWCPMWLAGTLTAVAGVAYFFLVNFFRSPRRHFRGDRHNAVVSSADGTVVALEETFEDEVLHCRCIQLSVFMSVLNVHANWFPVDGTVELVRHHAGRFMAAYLPKSSNENERSTVLLRTPAGQPVLLRQVAGAMARRIVTYAKPGEEADIDDHLGFIKFGSRVDLYLPLGTNILVSIGQKTVGGVTQVARLNPPMP
ncbi:MAG: phosphatidylserine decarboxylase family protein [Candidatus Amulumruptor caecigallinarius]|nr:phosphatidylserine decarboxylase family protein [Candidatus Amulumruptor caecigallinarius]MCM1396467.1 phosphatidylserine decarboxylase family protein [Candidatus Amulumruptor caecigallinarius]MCM1453476.1 phosphatidylserine decarboxylase family protein [bacterium]